MFEREDARKFMVNMRSVTLREQLSSGIEQDLRLLIERVSIIEDLLHSELSIIYPDLAEKL